MACPSRPIHGEEPLLSASSPQRQGASNALFPESEEVVHATRIALVVGTAAAAAAREASWWLAGGDRGRGRRQGGGEEGERNSVARCSGLCPWLPPFSSLDSARWWLQDGGCKLCETASLPDVAGEELMQRRCWTLVSLAYALIRSLRARKKISHFGDRSRGLSASGIVNAGVSELRTKLPGFSRNGGSVVRGLSEQLELLGVRHPR